MNIRFYLSLGSLLCFTCYAFTQKKSDDVKLDNKLAPHHFSGLSFRSIGPALTSGRVADFAVNPRNHSEYYVAVASGGVWKTTNKGTTYEPIFDGEGSYSTGCVTIDPTNDATVWVGSGENNNQRSVAYGDGVYRSDDRGKSWRNMGLKNSEHIAEIIVHPKDANTVYVASYGPLWSEGGERGVYKSTDGGESWKNVKSVSNFTGCNDLLMDPRDPNVLYAAFHQRMRKVYTYIGGGQESAVYKSIDGGTTWKKIEGGLPSGDLGRIGIAISKVNPDYIYAVVEAPKNGGIYRSTDRGASWTKMSGTYTSGNYYNEIECDPTDVNKIYITDSYYKVSYDGGKSVSNLGEINKHIDNHAIWIDPNNGNHMLVGCDGGIYETYDHAASWDYKSNLPITQFYKVATDNDFPFYHVHGGTQDNFSLGGPSRTTSANGIVNADWYITSLGDGFESQVDQSNPDIVYAQSQYGGLMRYDRKSGEYLSIRPIEGEGEAANRWNWDSPLLISQYDNKRLYFGSNKVYRTDDHGNSWRAISGDLSRGQDRNAFEVMARVQSVDAVAKNQSTDIFGQTTSIAESKYNQDMLWVGTDDGLIHLTKDGGRSWKKIDNIPGVPAMSYVHQIIASLHNENTAYVCFNHHRYGDFKPYVFKTTDGGTTWKSIANDLPVRGSVYSIAEDHVDQNLLFVGTEFGCYFSNNAGTHWYALKNGLPTIAVRDIEIQRRENDLVIATFGRGFYVLDDYTPLRSIKKEDFEKTAKLFPIKDAWMYIPKYPLGLRDKGHLGTNYYQAPNPEVGAVISYYTKDDLLTTKERRKKAEKDKYEKKERVLYPSIDSLRKEDNEVEPYLLLTITDADGDVVRHLKAPAKKGMNRITWDMRYGSPAPIQGRYTPGPDELFGSEEKGHLAMPGTYYASLSKFENGMITKLTNAQKFTCKLLPQGSLQAKDFTDNVKFYKQVTKATKELNILGDKLSSIGTRCSNIKNAAVDLPFDAKKYLEKSYDLMQKSIALRTSLFGDQTLSRREFETAPSIADRIGTCVYALWQSTASVPALYKDSFAIGNKQLGQIKEGIESLDKELKILEDDFMSKGGPYLGR